MTTFNIFHLLETWKFYSFVTSLIIHKLPQFYNGSTIVVQLQNQILWFKKNGAIGGFPPYGLHALLHGRSRETPLFVFIFCKLFNFAQYGTYENFHFHWCRKGVDVAWHILVDVSNTYMSPYGMTMSPSITYRAR